MARWGNGAQLAGELGITRQAVSRAEKAGRITRAANGKFDLDAAAIQYRLHTDAKQQQRGLGNQRRTPEHPAGGQDNSGQAPLMEDGSAIRRRRELAEARLAELEVQEKEGVLVRRDAQEAAARRLASAIVQQMSSIPDRFSAEFGADEEIRRKMRQRLREELDRVRAEFARAGLLAVQ